MASLIQDNDFFNPFPGLRPFTEDESNLFFGRDKEVGEIAAKLTNNGFVAVLGPSGSGKSSMVQCGLFHRIKRLSAGKDSDWRTISIKPGTDPFGNLADALLSETGKSIKDQDLRNEIISTLKNDPESIYEALDILKLKSGEKLLLFVDQFEEIFRLSTLGSGFDLSAERFVNLLVNTANLNKGRIYIVLAMRSDLLAECTRFKGLTQIVNGSNFLVPGMSRENFREAIEGPVKYAGASIDPGLVEILLDEVEGQPEQLPVLQHALMRTWTRWQELDDPGRPLSHSDYLAVGTMTDAISKHGDEIYDKLDTREKIICEKLFKTITGKSADNKGIRRPVNLQTIKTSLQFPSDELIKVIEAFRAPSISFLIPRYDVPLDDASVIDLSHESLINHWTRLRAWVEDEAESARMYLRLSEYAALYQQGKAGLMKQPELQLALDWRKKQKPDILWARRYDPAFERAIVFLRTSEKEYLEAEERKARIHRWKLKRTRIISSILAGVALLTALLLVLAVMGKLSSDARRRDAEKQKQEVSVQKSLAEEYAAIVLKRSVEADSVAEAARKSEMRIKELLENSEKQRLLAERKASEADRLNFITSRQFDSILHSRMASDLDLKVALEQKNETIRLRMISLAKSMALRSLQTEGRQDIQALLSYQAYLFNKKNNGAENDPDIYAGLYHTAKFTGNRFLGNFAGHTDAVKKIAFIPGRKEFFTTGEDGRVLRWNLDRPDQSMQVLYSDTEIIDVIAVSPDANWLACGGRDARIRMLPVEGNYLPYDLKGHTGSIKSLVFSYDGKSLYSAALDGKVLKWDLTARTYTDLSANVAGITSIDLSAGGEYLAGLNTDGGALVWKPERNNERFRIESPGRIIRSLKFKPDNPVLAVGYDDGKIEMWDITSGKCISEIKAHTSDITDIKFNSRLSQMATASTDGTLKLWDANNLSGLPVSFNDNNGLVITIEFSPDGQLLISGTDGSSDNLRSRPAYADLLAADMCSSIKRNFTPDEWIAYVGRDIEYEKTCSGLDYNIKIREVR